MVNFSVKKLSIALAVLIALALAKPLWLYLQMIMQWSSGTSSIIMAGFIGLILAIVFAKMQLPDAKPEPPVQQKNAVQNSLLYTQEQLSQQQYRYVVDELVQLLLWQQREVEFCTEQRLLDKLAQHLDRDTLEQLRKSLRTQAKPELTPVQFQQFLQAVQRML